MNDAEPIPEEMLSAYLDGELSEAEVVRVENQLERDDELRQTLSELTNIREQIKSLPQHTLSSDFAAQVTQQLANQSAAASEQTQQTPRPTPQTQRFRLAAVLAAIAALMLISVIGIKYLPTPNVAMNTPERNDAAPANESQTGLERELANSAAASPAAADTEDRLLETTSATSPEATMDLQIVSKSNSKPSAAKIASYDLIAEYEVDPVQLATLSQSWKQELRVTEASSRQPNVASFEFEGTYEEISILLGSVEYQASKIDGPAVNEFTQRGLSLAGQQLATHGMLPNAYNRSTPTAPRAKAAFNDGISQRRSISAERQLNKNSLPMQLPSGVEQPSATPVPNQSVVNDDAESKADADSETRELKDDDKNPTTVRLLVRLKEIK